METIETFVTASIHVNQKGTKFIRIRFQVDADTWFTAFNPTGVASVEWVRRVSRTTGKQRIQSRFPVKVSFARSVVGSDVVERCAIAPRVAPQEMTPAAEEDLAALTGAKGTVADATVAVAEAAADDIG